MSSRAGSAGRRQRSAQVHVDRAAERPFLSRGDVLQLRALDYKWGTADPLLLWIGRVIRIHELGDGLWIEVCGVELGCDGTPRRPRPSVAVRAAVVARSKCGVAAESVPPPDGTSHPGSQPW